MASKLGTLTDRDRYWFGHHAECEKSGLSAKAYARRHRLSVHSFYQARKRLRGLGALEVGAERRSKAKPGSGGGFARVEVATASRPRYRVRLSNGALVEWEGASGADLAEVLGVVSQLG